MKSDVTAVNLHYKDRRFFERHCDEYFVAEDLYDVGEQGAVVYFDPSLEGKNNIIERLAPKHMESFVLLEGVSISPKSANDPLRLVRDLGHDPLGLKPERHIPLGVEVAFANTLHGKEYLYVLQSHNGVKVGRSNNPERRLQTLKTADPTIQLLATVPVDGAERCERIAHKVLRPWRGDGEWFRCSPSLAISTVMEFMQDV